MSELENSQSSGAPKACTPESFLVVTAAFQKSQRLLDFTIAALLARLGVARVLFVTLTFPEHIRSTKAGQEKLNSFLNAVRKRHGRYLWVLEPQASGRIHYHLLIPVEFDCHAGTDLDAWGRKSFPMEGMYFHSENPARCGVCTRDTYLRNSMNPALRAEADWWQTAAKAHGFGRVQVAPIYGGADAVCNLHVQAGLAQPTLAVQGTQERPLLELQPEPACGHREVRLEFERRTAGSPAHGGVG